MSHLRMQIWKFPPYYKIIWRALYKFRTLSVTAENMTSTSNSMLVFNWDPWKICNFSTKFGVYIEEGKWKCSFHTFSWESWMVFGIHYATSGGEKVREISQSNFSVLSSLFTSELQPSILWNYKAGVSFHQSISLNAHCNFWFYLMI